MRNYIFIIGGMKCGTTSLYNYLEQHPQVCGCKAKEPHFFSADVQYNKGIDYYDSLFKFDESKHTHCIDGSVTYTMKHQYPDTVERIKAFGRPAKFIYIMRDPVQRIQSHASHNLRQGYFKEPMKEGVDDHLLQITRYNYQIEEYFKTFPADSIRLYKFEDIKNNIHEVMKDCVEFLGLDPDFTFSDPVRYNSSKTGNSRAHYVLSKVPFLKQVLRPISGKVKYAIMLTLTKLFGTRVKREDYLLSDEQKQIVHDELKEDLAALKANHSIDLA